ncbi:hypothetical protein [Flavobacterium sp.]|uniref:hypothetical protein n=1 Tax=Flavobacterium sp. TaxID=239 RepID=UPI003751E127
MKKIALMTITLIVLSSCSKDEPIDSTSSQYQKSKISQIEIENFKSVLMKDIDNRISSKTLTGKDDIVLGNQNQVLIYDASCKLLISSGMTENKVKSYSNHLEVIGLAMDFFANNNQQNQSIK